MALLNNEKEHLILDDEERYNKILLDRLIQEDDIDGFREEFLAMHSYEQSEYFEDSDESIHQKMYQYLSPEEVSQFF